MPALLQPAVEPLVLRTETRVIDPLRTPGWDDLIVDRPDVTPFHTVAWATVLHRTYGHTPCYLVQYAVPDDGGQRTVDGGQRTVVTHPATPGHGFQLSAFIPHPSARPGHGFQLSGFIPHPSLLLSVLPLMEVNSPFTGRRGVALPFTDTCPALRTVDGGRWTEVRGQRSGDRGQRTVDGGQRSGVRGQGSGVSPQTGPSAFSFHPSSIPRSPISDPAAVTNHVHPSAPISDLRSPISDLLALARSRRWRSIEWRGGPPPTPDATPSQSFYIHTLDLTGDPKELFARCDPATRRAVRKAKQAGLEVDIGHTLGALHEFYALHCQTRRKHGLPPQPFAFFLALHDEIISRGHGFIAVARQGLRPLAAAVFLHFGSRAVYKYGASDDTELPLRANNLVMWESIRWLARHEFESLDLGRTSLNQDGLRRFKLGWGTTERILHYYRYCLRTHRFVTVPDRAHGWHNRVFARLPLTVNRVIGAVLYRHMD